MPVAPYFFSYLGERILAPSRPPLPHGRSSFQAEFSSSLKFAAGKGAFNRLDVFAEFGINLRRGPAARADCEREGAEKRAGRISETPARSAVAAEKLRLGPTIILTPCLRVGMMETRTARSALL